MIGNHRLGSALHGAQAAQPNRENTEARTGSPAGGLSPHGLRRQAANLNGFCEPVYYNDFLLRATNSGRNGFSETRILIACHSLTKFKESS